MHYSLLGRVIDAGAWPEPVLAEVCGTMARLGGTINNCVTEADLGSISRGGLPAMTAEPAPGGWLLSGRKIFVTGAPVLRWLATRALAPMGWPIAGGTLLVNLLGGLLIGASLVWFERQPSEFWRLALVTGGLGGLTTFSAFSVEIVALLQQGRLLMAATAVAAHLGGSLLATLAGLFTYQWAQQALRSPT